MADYKEDKEDDLSKLIRLSYVVAKPWRICTWLLAVLLIGSLSINAYLISHNSVTLDLYADSNIESDITQHNE